MIDLSRLARGVTTSRTLYAVAGLLGVNLADPSGLDVRLWVNGQIFDLGDLSPILSVLLTALAVYGRLMAQGPLVVGKPVAASSAPQQAEQRGFPRG